MKTEAYVCDFCQELRYSAEVTGIMAQEDLFSKLDGYPIIPHADRALIHLCNTCYNLHVVAAAERTANRKQNEEGYKLKLKELSYLVKSQCVANYNKKSQKKISKK
jgi:hypothetical protein